jgi:hypothetical protein
MRLVCADRESEAANEVIERRWFALLSAIRSLQTECSVLLEASKLADVAWRRACMQLAEFEALRDALEEEMSVRAPAAPMTRSEYRSGGRRWTAATSAR